jgi:hypothetical protein
LATVNKDFRVKNNLSLASTADTATAASHYFVETASDGVIRPKTLADTRTEIVTTASVNAAAATTVGTITSGVWNAGAVTSSGSVSGTTGVFSSTISASGLAGSLLSATVGSALGTAAAGTSTIPARADHVHPTTGLMTNPLTTNGDTIYAVGTTPTRLAIGTAGQAYVVNSGATAPAWTTLTLENLPGAFVKKSVRAATTANVTLAGGAPSTLDGVTLVLNDRILVKDQSAPAQNGIYYVSTLGTGANGTWTRSLDADTIGEIASAMVAVDEGTTNGGLTFDNDSKTTDTLGTTAVTWNRVVDLGYSMNIGTTAVPLNRASAQLTLAGITLTTPVIDSISASAAAATPSLWPTVTTGSIAVGAGLTTGALNIATVGTSVTPISIGHTNATLAVVSSGFNLTTGGALTLTSTVAASGLAGSLLSSANPVINGTAAPGTSTIPSRQDHVHPTDTTRAPLASPTFTGKVTTAATAVGGAGLNLPHGTAPSAPVNGDVWTTTAGMYARINGVTVGPFGAGGGGASVTVSDTAPVGPSPGNLWFDSTTTKTYIYYDSHWVQVSGGAIIATNLIGGNGTTLLGSVPYQSGTDTTTLLAPNTSTTRAFFGMTGTGTNGAAPSWTSSTGTGNVVLASTPTITTPVIDSISASAAAATPTLWPTVTTGTIAIGAGLTTGTLNIATVGTGATPINIGHTNATIGVTGNTTITGTLTVTGNLDTNLTTAGVVTTSAAGVLSSSTLLPIANGGTNSSATPTAGGAVYGTGTAYAVTAAGTAGQFLQSNGAGAPTWAAVVGSVYQATAPGSPSTGAIWTDSDLNVMYQYNGTAWVSPNGIEIFTPTFTTNNYTTILADQGRMLMCGNSTVAGTVTISSAVAYPIGTQIQVTWSSGTGQISLVGSGVTINATPGLKLRALYSSATLVKTAATTWLAVGDLIA